MTRHLVYVVNKGEGYNVLGWYCLQPDCRPFKVAEGVKMNSENYRNFLTDNFVPWYQNLPPNEKKRMVFMQDNAPSHASSMTMDFFGRTWVFWIPVDDLITTNNLPT